MQIILLERIEKLGSIGDVVSVKDGYARNFLLPNKKALRANEANRKVFEANRERIESENVAKRDEAAKSAESVDGMQVVLIRASSNSGQLYGSVSVRDIADALNEAGVDVMRQMFEEDQQPAGFVEKFDPNAEPGLIPQDEPEEAEAEGEEPEA
ncbi:MAG: 50S ribosomal protein L9 [Blastomonas sp.]|nr:50S ribosomal protein L9 [Blastomonas sp.]